MDVGIIQRMKLKYRKRMVSNLLGKIDKCELAMQISVLDAIQWMQKAWHEVEKSTIHKCYKKCGFSIDVPTMRKRPKHQEKPTTIIFYLKSLG